MPNYATKLFIYHNCLSPKPNFSLFLLDCTSLCWVLCALETQKQDALMVVVCYFRCIQLYAWGGFLSNPSWQIQQKTFPCSPRLEHIYMSSVLTTPAAYFFMYPDFLSFKWKEERFKTLDIVLICFDWTEFDRYKHVMYKAYYLCGAKCWSFFFKKKSNRLRFSMFYFMYADIVVCTFPPFSSCKIERVHVSFICTKEMSGFLL